MGTLGRRLDFSNLDAERKYLMLNPSGDPAESDRGRYGIAIRFTVNILIRFEQVAD